MNHPAEDVREESTAGRFTSFLGLDVSGQTKPGVALEHFRALIMRRQTQVNVQVQLRHAQGNALVELVFAEAGGSGEHRPD